MAFASKKKNLHEAISIVQTWSSRGYLNAEKFARKKINKWQVLIFQENIKHLWLFSSFLENMKTLMAVFKFCRKYKKSFYWSQVFCEIKNSWLF